MLIGLVWMNTYVEGLTFGFVVLGVIGALIQWNRQLRREAAEFLKGLMEELRSTEVSSFLYDIDYGEDWYGQDFHESKKEAKVDRTLSFLSFLCYLRSKHLFGKAEFKFFEYELMRVIGNEQVVDYLYNIHHFSAGQGRPSPFEHLIDYGIKVGLVNKKDFFDPTTCRRNNCFHKYLNF